MSFSPSSRQHGKARRIGVDRLNYFRSNPSSPSPSPSPSPPSPGSHQANGMSPSLSPPESPTYEYSPIPVLTTSDSDKTFNRQQYNFNNNSNQNSNRNSPTSSYGNRPPIVNPVMPQSPSKSWDEGDDAPAKSRCRSSNIAQNSCTRMSHHTPIALTKVQSDLTGTSTLKPRFNLNPRIRDSDMHIQSDCMGRSSYYDSTQEETDIGSTSSQFDNSFDYSRKTTKSNITSTDHRPPTPTNTTGTGCTASTLPTSAEDDVSSLGGIEDCTNLSGSSLMKLVAALKNNSDQRPTNLTATENALWDVVITLKRQAHVDALESGASRNGSGSSNSPLYHNELQKYNQQGNSPSNSDFSQSKNHEVQDLSMIKDLATSPRVLQRALAEAEAERDKVLEQMVDLKPTFKRQSYSAAIEDIDSVADMEQEEDYDALKQTLKDVHTRIFKIETKLSKATSLQHLSDNFPTFNRSSDEDGFLFDRSISTSKVDSSKDLKQPESTNSKSSSDVTERLRKLAEEKSAALENAKMIIASLENSSNRIAAELRAKLKVKDDEFNKLKRDSEERQKTLDTLATELRDLQSNKKNRNFCSEFESSRRFTLSSRLEKIITEIRAATVVLESTHDPAAVHALGEILEDAVKVLKDGINVIEDCADDASITDADSVGSGNDNARLLRLSSDVQRLRRELDEKKKIVRQLEDSLRKSKEEGKRLRMHMDDIRRNRDDEIQSLRAEIKILRQQCNTNMEVLTKKERELAVLRDSLQVEDVNVGYISDDNSEGDDEDEESSHPPALSLSTVDYGPSQAEALATLLAQGGNHSFDAGGSGPVRTQMESLRLDLARALAEKEKIVRELKVEKESLSNAKMIISSLERANKSMMEDLRSRLHDSNSAIACLLEKSVESEKASSRLRAELAEALQRERDRSFEDHSNSHALMILPVETID